jgi:hypothetical protein
MPLCERTPELDPGLRRGDGPETNKRILITNFRKVLGLTAVSFYADFFSEDRSVLSDLYSSIDLLSESHI